MGDSCKEEKNSKQCENPAPDLHRKLPEIASKVTQEALDEFLPDFTENLDY